MLALCTPPSESGAQSVESIVESVERNVTCMPRMYAFLVYQSSILSHTNNSELRSCSNRITMSYTTMTIMRDDLRIITGTARWSGDSETLDKLFASTFQSLSRHHNARADMRRPRYSYRSRSQLCSTRPNANCSWPRSRTRPR